ncbi:DUF1329 domain-containing protein [Aromatoleum evansii]|uniref:DUF1329 domain-containing protein n=1 Tax=Aromatoleum evansii TaxID=59406 RepID=UPI00145D8ABB|nr:DUF1329 domain-containing protein [Aromatoleum evansii]NMG30198.1 DUF1329 domain-containing protein [Aromatoleum evansii]
MSSHKLSMLLAAVIGCSQISVAVAAGDADRLGKELTPLGGEKKGNADGSIPAWEGLESAPNGWVAGKYRGDYAKTKDEKALFSIDASNVDKYASKLTPGQIALIKQSKGYRMDVYPTHRNCGVPAWVEERTKENATEAKMAPDGFSLEHARAGGVPFPIPKSGVEAMWNHKLRSTGVGFDYKQGVAALSPSRGTNDFVFSTFEITQYYPHGTKEAKNVEDAGKVEFYTYYKYKSPVSLAGQALVSTSYLDRPAEVSYYFPGQRRVRRLPTYAYDAPLLGFENEYMVDIQNMFWSQLDRFDYKLAGKKEIYIAHNAFKMYDFNAKLEDVFKRDFINPDVTRYELHRVWVVEATVKQGQRHTTPKRTYYLDEDSWNLVAAEDYDANGNIWNVRQTFQIPVWELGGTCTYGPWMQYSLQSGRYVADNQVIGQGSDVKFLTSPDGGRFKANFYTPDTLRATSER